VLDRGKQERGGDVSIVSGKDRFEKVVEAIIFVIGLVMAVYSFVNIRVLLHNPAEYEIIFLGLALILVFLASIRGIKQGMQRSLGVACAFLGAAICIYLYIEFSRLQWMYGFALTRDAILAMILVALVLEGSRRTFGPILTVMSVILVAYLLFGHFIPGYLGHPHISTDGATAILALSLDSGIFGEILRVATDYIFPLMIFGSTLGVLGAPLFFNQVSRIAGRFVAGGSGQTATISSGLFGMLNGSAAANVAITGAFTIPAMIKEGFSPARAGGIETASGSGGQIMPPVMGVIAFIMAVYLGRPYVEICILGTIPALIYYVTLVFGVRALAKIDRISPVKEPIDKRDLIAGAPVFLVPLIVIVALLVMRYTVMMAAFYATLATLVVGFARKRTRPTLTQFAMAVRNGAFSGAEIIVVSAALGVIAACLINTGLSPKLTTLVEIYSYGNTAIALFLAMILTMIFGCGLPGIAVYVLVVSLVVPMLERMGIWREAAHMFVFYYACAAAATPPVAPGAIVASKIANAHFMKIGWEASKLLIATLILPFLYVFNHILLFRFSGESVSTIILTLVATILGLICSVAAIHGVALEKIRPLERVPWACAALVLFGYVTTRISLLAWVGLLLVGFLAFMDWRRRKSLIQTPVRGAAGGSSLSPTQS
jgi:TRAP transporter 4TM/12TM fusion protein